MFVVCVDVYIYFSFVPVGQSLRSFSPLLPGNDCSSLIATHASEHCLPFSPALVMWYLVVDPTLPGDIPVLKKVVFVLFCFLFLLAKMKTKNVFLPLVVLLEIFIFCLVPLCTACQNTAIFFYQQRSKRKMEERK